MTNAIDWAALEAIAKNARAHAYAPYSRFHVGAALQTEDGTIFSGCNVENTSFGLTVCAERNAIFAAVAAGHQRFVALAIVATSDAPITPCGACRQVLAEFPPDVPIHCYGQREGLLVTSTEQLLPYAFKKP